MNREHGHFHWNELMTNDREAAAKFYADTLGWTYNDMPMPEGFVYKVIMVGEQPVGGMMQIAPHMGEMADHWIAYVAVDDVDARVAKVEAAGGKIAQPPFDVEGVGRIAMVVDATGAAMGWIQPAPQPQG